MNAVMIAVAMKRCAEEFGAELCQERVDARLAEAFSMMGYTGIVVIALVAALLVAQRLTRGNR